MIGQPSKELPGQVGTRPSVVLRFPVPKTDAGLVAALRSGHPDAKEALCERYSGELLRIATRILGPNACVGSLVAGTIRRALECLDELPDSAKFRGWLLSLLVAAARRRLRDQRRWRWFSGAQVEDRFDGVRASQETVSAYCLLDRLDIEQRVAFCLVVIDWMPPVDAARLLGVSWHVMKRWLAAAHVDFGRRARSEFPRLMRRNLSHAALGAEIAREQDRILGESRIFGPDLLRGSERPWSGSHSRSRQIGWPLAMVIVPAALASTIVALASHFYYARVQALGGLSPMAESTRTGQWVTAPPQQRGIVSFEDGSGVTLAPGARMRILTSGHAGNACVLESGGAKLSTGESSRGEQRMAAGPFVVSLGQGEVALTWDSKSEQLDVAVHHGEVWLAGCQFGTGKSVQVGQPLQIRCLAR
jgi:DNA-directed RNA polymerase specialized sigma24 family protein